jgi:hypothetical protein
VIEWEKGQKRLRFQEIVSAEEDLERLYSTKALGSMSAEVDQNIKELEEKRQRYLLAEEETWRQKSKATWLQKGDRNTKIFHHFV